MKFRLAVNEAPAGSTLDEETRDRDSIEERRSRDLLENRAAPDGIVERLLPKSVEPDTERGCVESRPGHLPRGRRRPYVPRPASFAEREKSARAVHIRERARPDGGGPRKRRAPMARHGGSHDEPVF